jgi:hypothetical protein
MMHLLKYIGHDEPILTDSGHFICRSRTDNKIRHYRVERQMHNAFCTNYFHQHDQCFGKPCTLLPLEWDMIRGVHHSFKVAFRMEVTCDVGRQRGAELTVICEHVVKLVAAALEPLNLDFGLCLILTKARVSLDNGSSELDFGEDVYEIYVPEIIISHEDYELFTARLITAFDNVNESSNYTVKAFTRRFWHLPFRNMVTKSTNCANGYFWNSDILGVIPLFPIRCHCDIGYRLFSMAKPTGPTDQHIIESFKIYALKSLKSTVIQLQRLLYPSHIKYVSSTAKRTAATLLNILLTKIDSATEVDTNTINNFFYQHLFPLPWLGPGFYKVAYVGYPTGLVFRGRKARMEDSFFVALTVNNDSFDQGEQCAKVELYIVKDEELQFGNIYNHNADRLCLQSLCFSQLKTLSKRVTSWPRTSSEVGDQAKAVNEWIRDFRLDQKLNCPVFASLANYSPRINAAYNDVSRRLIDLDCGLSPVAPLRSIVENNRGALIVPIFLAMYNITKCCDPSELCNFFIEMGLVSPEVPATSHGYQALKRLTSYRHDIVRKLSAQFTINTPVYAALLTSVFRGIDSIEQNDFGHDGVEIAFDNSLDESERVFLCEPAIQADLTRSLHFSFEEKRIVDPDEMCETLFPYFFAKIILCRDTNSTLTETFRDCIAEIAKRIYPHISSGNARGGDDTFVYLPEPGCWSHNALRVSANSNLRAMIRRLGRALKIYCLRNMHRIAPRNFTSNPDGHQYLTFYEQSLGELDRDNGDDAPQVGAKTTQKVSKRSSNGAGDQQNGGKTKKLKPLEECFTMRHNDTQLIMDEIISTAAPVHTVFGNVQLDRSQLLLMVVDSNNQNFAFDLLSHRWSTPTPEFYLSMDNSLRPHLSEEQYHRAIDDVDTERLINLIYKVEFIDKFRLHLLSKTARFEPGELVGKTWQSIYLGCLVEHIATCDADLAKKVCDRDHLMYLSKCYIYLGQLMGFQGQKLNYLAYLLSLLIRGGNFFRKFTVFVGVGANGKTSLIKSLRMIFNTYFHTCCATSLQKLGGIQSDLAQAAPTGRIAACEEICKVFSNTLKLLTGDGDMYMREIYKKADMCEMMPKVICVCNAPPTVSPFADNATLERFLPIYFLSRFTSNAPAEISQQVSRDEYICEPMVTATDPSLVAGLFLTIAFVYYQNQNFSTSLPNPKAIPACLRDEHEIFCRGMKLVNQFVESSALIISTVNTNKRLASSTNEILGVAELEGKIVAFRREQRIDQAVSTHDLLKEFLDEFWDRSSYCEDGNALGFKTIQKPTTEQGKCGGRKGTLGRVEMQRMYAGLEFYGMRFPN